MALALNNFKRLICHLTKKPDQKKHFIVIHNFLNVVNDLMTIFSLKQLCGFMITLDAFFNWVEFCSKKHFENWFDDLDLPKLFMNFFL